MKAHDKNLHDLESPFDLCEMMTVAWIRFVASAAHAFFALQTPQTARATNETSRARFETEDEALLHVLE